MLEPLTIRRQQLIGAANDHGHLHIVTAAERVEIAQVARVPADESNGFERLVGQSLSRDRHPLRQPLATALDGEPIAQVVGKNDGERGEQLILDVALDGHEPAVDGEPVVHVAVENELPGGAALEGNRQFGGPLRRTSRCPSNPGATM